MISEDKEYYNPLTYILLGMKRCGYFGVANWLMKQSINTTTLHIPCQGFESRIYDNLKKHSLENHILMFQSNEIEKALDYKNNNTKMIAVLRDPYNNLASILKLLGKNRRSFPAFIQMWKTAATLFLNPEYYGINFNEWFSDSEYRELTCLDLNLVFNDNGLNIISKRGHGSSFDGLDYDGKAQEMDVLNRWKHFIEDPDYQRYVLQDNELKEYSDEIFGPIIES